MAQVVKLFLQYDVIVVDYVVNTLPRARSAGWDGLPSIATIAEALDRRAMKIAAELEQTLRIQRQNEAWAAERRARADAEADGAFERVSAGFDDLREKLRGGVEADTERRKANLALIQSANARVLAGMHAEAGVLPDGIASPALLRAMGKTTEQSDDGKEG